MTVLYYTGPLTPVVLNNCYFSSFKVYNMCSITKNVNTGSNVSANVCCCSILWCPHERCYSCLDVPVLWPGFLRAEDPEVPVVEEVFDHHPDGKILLLHATAAGLTVTVLICLVMMMLRRFNTFRCH